MSQLWFGLSTPIWKDYKFNNFLKNIASYYAERIPGEEGRNPSPIRQRCMEKLLIDLKRLLPNVTDMSLLDVGCGWGNGLLRIAKAYYLEVVGVEPNSIKAQYASREIGITVKAESYHAKSFPPSRFDVITFIQVMEHLSDPLAAMRAAYKHLKLGGILVVEVPSFNSPRVLAYRVTSISAFARRDFIPQHIFFFTPSVIAQLAVASGFCVKEIYTGNYATKIGFGGFWGSSMDYISNCLRIGGITLFAEKKAKTIR